MKAIVWTKYGTPDVFQLKDVAKPTPKDNEVLIKIHATTATAGDCELRNLSVPILFRLPLWLYVGVRRPKRITVLGQELAGEIEAIGRNVKHFKPGDLVFATTGLGFGAYAEYICLPEDPGTAAMALKPVGMSAAEAASTPVGALEALHFMRRGNVQPGESILINGAGGSIGTFAVQLAKYLGANVTAVDRAEKLEMLRSLGADHVIDYTQQDFSKSGEHYDVILDVPGKSSFAGGINALKPKGRYLLANPSLLSMLRGPWVSLLSDKKVIIGAANQKTEDLIYIKKLIEAGKLKSVIDRSYSLEQTAEAHRYVETGQKKGNVVIVVSQKSTVSQ